MGNNRRKHVRSKLQSLSDAARMFYHGCGIWWCDARRKLRSVKGSGQHSGASDVNDKMISFRHGSVYYEESPDVALECHRFQELQRDSCIKQTAPRMFPDTCVIWSGMVHLPVTWPVSFCFLDFTGHGHATRQMVQVCCSRRDSLECCLQGMHLVVCTSWGYSDWVCLILASWDFDHSSTCVTKENCPPSFMDKLHGQATWKGFVNILKFKRFQWKCKA